jgi:putative membrane protein
MSTEPKSSPALPTPPDLPEDLASSLQGKDSGTSSTILSTHRTRLSIHRTGLSDLRSHLANERTHLAYLRTAISLIGFGITINRFSLFLQEHRKLAVGETGPMLRSSEHAGAGMVVIGLVLIAWPIYRYWHVNQDIVKGQFRPLHRAVVMLSVLLVLAGGFTAVWLFVQS